LYAVPPADVVGDVLGGDLHEQRLLSDANRAPTSGEFQEEVRSAFLLSEGLLLHAVPPIDVVGVVRGEEVSIEQRLLWDANELQQACSGNSWYMVGL
jgi:hypothetical protein